MSSDGELTLPGAPCNRGSGGSLAPVARGDPRRRLFLRLARIEVVKQSPHRQRRRPLSPRTAPREKFTTPGMLTVFGS